MSIIKEGSLLWSPPESLRAQSRMSDYMAWLSRERGQGFDTYQDLWRWSVDELETFWGSLWDYFGVAASKPYDMVLQDRSMPGANWFPGAELSIVENVFRQSRPGRPALRFSTEDGDYREVSWDELEASVASVANGLRNLGVQPGDRVVSYMPHIPETVIAFLGAASVGAIWSSCSPDFGPSSVVDRFRQIEPRVLFAVDGYRYGGQAFDRLEMVRQLQAALPTLQHTVVVSQLGLAADISALGGAIRWDELLGDHSPLDPVHLPFSHPLWVVYTSGTTGLPKPIVHSQGGVLLETYKALALHLDLGRDDVFFWFTTTGWVMWNILVGGLLTGASIVLFDGSPAQPDLGALWRLAERAGTTLFGGSAAFLTSCMKAGLRPGREHDLSRLRTVGSTGSPLTPEGFSWVYDNVKSDLWLASISGGTDVCTAFVGACPLLPVHAGELQCRYLGVDAQAFDPDGRPLIDEVGELVITAPMPSMPVRFWNDPGDRRYRESYFETFPGVWRHGDWIKFTARGSATIYGRSDSTVNRTGVRIGTSDIYRVVEALPEIADSLVVDLEAPGEGPYMPLFVVLAEGARLDEALRGRIREEIRRQLSPRHVPDDIITVSEVPRTLNGKKLEVPVKRLLMGTPVGQAVSTDAMSNPGSLGEFLTIAQQRESGWRPSSRPASQ